MNDLQNKTNFELNVLVAMHEHPHLAKVSDHKILTGCVGEATFLDVSEVMDDVYGKPPIDMATYNYTGDWAQMGPIIEREGIDIEWPEKHLGSVGQVSKYLQGDTDITVEFSDKKDGLRTAAICYLMMRS